MVSKRNGEIDFFRFIFAVLIVFFHFNSNFKFNFFVNGWIGVEFFFVVSGYLMARHVSLRNISSKDLGFIADETWQYLLNKIRSFYTYYVSVILLQVVIGNIIVNHSGSVKAGYSLLRSIPTFSLTFMGLGNSTSLYVGNTWYLSAMLIAIFLLYPLLLRHYKFSVEIVFPFFAVFILGYLIAINNTIANWEGWSGLVYFGVLRAIAEIALGGSIFQLSTIIASSKSRILYSENHCVKAVMTFFKAFCYAVVIAFAYGSILGEDFKPEFSLHALLFCSLGILLSFSNVGYCIPDNTITRYLGKISLPIFIYHGFIRWTVWDYIGHSISVTLFATLIILGIITSIALMYLTDYISSRLKQLIAKT